MSSKNVHIPIGSCNIYCTFWDGSNIPDDAAFEVEANCLGGVEKGAEIGYKPTFKKFKDDTGQYRRDALTADEATLKASMIAWSTQDLNKFGTTVRVDSASKPGHVIVKIGGVCNAVNTPWLFRAVHKDPEYGDVRVTMVGTSQSELKLDFKPEDTGNVDLEVSATALDEEGTLILLDETLPGTATAATGLSVSSAAGSTTGKTALTVTPSATSGNSYVYKLGANIPNVGDILMTGWTFWDGSVDITAATGSIITVAEIDGSNKAVKAGVTSVTAKS